MQPECEACGGTGACQNDHHNPYGSTLGPCPECGGDPFSPGDCSVCGGVASRTNRCRSSALTIRLENRVICYSSAATQQLIEPERELASLSSST